MGTADPGIRLIGRRSQNGLPASGLASQNGVGGMSVSYILRVGADSTKIGGKFFSPIFEDRSHPDD